MSLVLDVLIVIVLLLFLNAGMKQGLVNALAGLIVVVIALVGASFVTGTLTEPVAKILEPVVAKQIETKLEHSISEKAGQFRSGSEQESPAGVEELLEQLGIDEKLIAEFSQDIRKHLENGSMSAIEAITGGVIRSVVSGVLFAFSFIILLLAITVIIKMLNLVTLLPVIHSLNKLGGGAIGLIKGMIVLAVGIWIVRRFFIQLDPAVINKTYFFKYFTGDRLLSAMMSIF